MKISDIAVIVAFHMLLSACGGNKMRIEPPRNVQLGFETQFGQIRHAEWTNPAQDTFQVRFIRDNHPMSAFFDVMGKWIKTETHLMPSELPAVIVRTVEGAFPGRSIDKALQINEAGKEQIYRMFLKKGRQLTTVDLNTQGVILINTIR